MIERIFKCDLCREPREKIGLVGFRWKGKQIELVDRIHDTEHHLCTDCMNEVAALANKVRGHR